MKTIKITILAVILTLFIGLLWGSLMTPTSAQTQGKTEAMNVNYAPVPAGVYNLDPAHSLIGFAVEHLEINWVEGRFKDFTGTINYNDQDVTKSTVEFSARIASIAPTYAYENVIEACVGWSPASSRTSDNTDASVM